MIHFATVHYHSDLWIDVQLDMIDRYTNEPYAVWGCLNGIDERYAVRFHRTFDLEGKHGEKLNELAAEICREADEDDLIVFIDGDAFPIDDWVPPVRELLATAPLVAVRRSENLGDPQPHPCFAVCSVGFWKRFQGDWAWGGKTWINSVGLERQDAGGRVLAKLEEQDIPWHPLERSNAVDLHPVLFGVYADIVYHHGAGFRSAGTSVDHHIARTLYDKRGIKGFVAARRIALRKRRNLAMSKRVIAELLTDRERVGETVRRKFLARPDRSSVR